MTSGNRIDFNEPIPEMITRLKSEHKKFEFDMAKIKTSIKDDNITYGSCCSSEQATGLSCLLVLLQMQ